MSKKSKNNKNRGLIDPHAEREAHKYASPIPSRELILQVLKDRTAPTTLEKLQTLLDLREDTQIDALSRRLTAMLRDGQIIQNRREGFLPVNERDLIRGRIIAHPDGYGFLHPEDGSQDLFIPLRQMRSVMHGDRVVGRIAGMYRSKREAAIIEVLERAHQKVVGRLFIEKHIAYVAPDHKRLTQDILIPEQDLQNAKSGQIVVAEIVEHPTNRRQPIGRIIEVLGNHMAPGMEIDVAINSHNLPNEWPAAVLEQVKDFQDTPSKSEIQTRVDFRNTPLVTIDGVDARDFDDAVFCEPKKSGWRLLVAIADVAHYVQPGSPLDDEAYNRGTSVYFPERVIPMLPEVLSNGLCSINPNVDRLCMVCEMDIDASGELKKYTFMNGVMRSQARLTYTEVSAILEKQDAALSQKYSKLLPHLNNLYALYKTLAKIRARRGSIEFDTTETRIVFGKDRKIEAIVPTARNDAHRLIEECMIHANIAAASFLTKHKIPGLYRVHEKPPEEKIEALKDFLGELNITFAAKGDPEAKTYAQLLERIRERPDARLIQTVMLRSLAQAVYSPDNQGHFGLALEKYAHFTSPIRRYPDLLVHRAIKHILLGEKVQSYTYTQAQMIVMGEQCSMTERRADDATRDAVDWLKCEYMVDKVGETYEGLITSVTSFGLFVELNDIFVEGLVHVTSLDNDYYHFDPVGHKLIGERSGFIYQLGDPIRVTVKSVDLDERKIDLESASLPKKKGRAAPSKKQHQKKTGKDKEGKKSKKRKPRRRPKVKSK